MPHKNAVNKGFHAARIVQKRMLSPTVCWIHLDVSPVEADAVDPFKPTPTFKSTSTPTLTFEPGQWVDFVVPGLPWVGGFSLVSDPADLPVLSLAVRLGLRPTQSTKQQQQQQKQKQQQVHAQQAQLQQAQAQQAPLPSTWVHDESRVGSNVEIRVGGTCTLRLPLPLPLQRPVVFCAGGIGIVTMLSLYRAHYRLMDTDTTLPDIPPPQHNSPTTLFYSASTQEEMVFVDELIDLVSTYGTQARGDRLVLALTQQTAWKHASASTSASTSASNAEQTEQEKTLVDSTSGDEEGLIEYRTGRELRNFLSEQADDSVYYLCGPPAMIDEAVRILVEDRGVPETDIIYEKWW